MQRVGAIGGEWDRLRPVTYSYNTAPGETIARWCVWEDGEHEH